MKTNQCEIVADFFRTVFKFLKRKNKLETIEKKIKKFNYRFGKMFVAFFLGHPCQNIEKQLDIRKGKVIFEDLSKFFMYLTKR